MTEQTTPTDPPQSPEAATPPPTPEAAKPTKEPKEVKDAKRFAVYDKTYLRFVGDVHDTKAAATKDARDRKVSAFEIREV